MSPAQRPDLIIIDDMGDDEMTFEEFVEREKHRQQWLTFLFGKPKAQPRGKWWKRAFIEDWMENLHVVRTLGVGL